MLEEIAKWQFAKNGNVLLRNNFKNVSTFLYFFFSLHKYFGNLTVVWKTLQYQLLCIFCPPQMTKTTHSVLIGKVSFNKGFILTTNLNPFDFSELSTDLRNCQVLCWASLQSSTEGAPGLSGVLEYRMKSENKAWRNKQKISTALGDFELCLYSISKVCFVCLKKSCYSGARSRSSISSSDE